MYNPKLTGPVQSQRPDLPMGTQGIAWEAPRNEGMAWAAPRSEGIAWAGERANVPNPQRQQMARDMLAKQLMGGRQVDNSQLDMEALAPFGLALANKYMGS